MDYKPVRLLCWIILLIVAGYQTVAGQDTKISVIMVGVPKHWGETRDYNDWFMKLKAAGVTAFLPFSEYQEAPEVLSLGYEVDFLPPCDRNSPAFQALRKHDMKLIVPAQLLYAPDNFPSLQDDPLLALSQCAGEGMIAAVLSIDEPFYAPRDPVDPYKDVRELYERVKTVTPELPVLMVHAPVLSQVTGTDGQARAVTQDEVDYYLSEVEHLSDYADIIGFDLYPIPTELMGFSAPGQNGLPVDYTIAFPSYMDWLRQHAGERQYMMVLQGFSFEDQFSPEMAQQVKDAGYTMRVPDEGELRTMACDVWQGGGSVIAWWGPSLLVEDDEVFWNQILEVSQHITSEPAEYCAG